LQFGVLTILAGKLESTPVIFVAKFVSYDSLQLFGRKDL